MSDRDGPLDASATELLLTVLEMPDATLSGSVLEDYYPIAGRSLIAAGILKSAGHEAVAASMVDHNDLPVSLSRSDDGRGFGHFDPSAGWVKVADDRLTRYQADLAALTTLLGDQVGVGHRPPRPILPNQLWELGEARIGRRAHRTPVLFGRRLLDPGVWRRSIDALRARPAPRVRILLTSTSPERLSGEPLANTDIIWLPDVLAANRDLVIDREILAARFDRMPARRIAGPLEIIADGREVRLFEQTFNFKKGVQQRRIIMLLYEHYQDGERWVSTDKIVAELDLRDGARIRDFFKKSPSWNRLLTEHSGMCGFCLDGPVTA